MPVVPFDCCMGAATLILIVILKLTLTLLCGLWDCKNSVCSVSRPETAKDNQTHVIGFLYILRVLVSLHNC